MEMDTFTYIMLHYLYDHDDQHEHVSSLALIALDRTSTEPEAVTLLSEWLEAEYKQTAPRISGVYGELFQAALDLILFEQIAQRFIDES